MPDQEKRYRIADKKFRGLVFLTTITNHKTAIGMLVQIWSPCFSIDCLFRFLSNRDTCLSPIGPYLYLNTGPKQEQFEKTINSLLDKSVKIGVFRYEFSVEALASACGEMYR